MDYSYIFTDLNNDFGQLKVIDRRIDREYQVATRIDDTAFTKTNIGRLTSLLADLVDLAVSIYVSDWLLPKKQNESLNIHVVLPIRNPSFFSQPWLLKELHCLLRWYTDDKWHFEFQARKSAKRDTERQTKFALFSESTEVALWSGGLDSLAGVVGRIKSHTASWYTLFGTGSSTRIQGKQHEIAGGLKDIYPYVKLIQLPIQLDYPGQKPPTNDMFRVRGFVFKLLGSICAQLEGESKLYIYENGFGAINLPFTRVEKGIAHTRSVHPISLLDTGDFVAKIIGSHFKYDNPYLFSSKAQMCKSLAPYADLAFNTVTCDSPMRQTGQPTQCGSCSSCLLRRMALQLALGKDQTEYVVTHGQPSHPLLQRSHFKAMNYQVENLTELLSTNNSWASLLQYYPELRILGGRLAKEYGKSIIVIQDCLLQLYQTHVDEWLQTRHLLEIY